MTRSVPCALVKAYLAGTAKEVWVPNVRSARNGAIGFTPTPKPLNGPADAPPRLRSFLSDNGVRLDPGPRLTQVEKNKEPIRHAHSWSSRQWQVIEILLAELRHADQQRRHWHSLMAQEVLADPDLLSLVRLCGVCSKWSRLPGAPSWVTSSALPLPSS